MEQTYLTLNFREDGRCPLIKLRVRVAATYASVVVTVLLIFGSGCSAQKKENAGAVLYKYRILNQSRQAYEVPKYMMDVKVIYKDSFIIGALSHADIYTDSMEKETWKVSVDKYVFANLRTRSFYDYKTFSDTATMLRAMFPTILAM